MKDVLTTAEGVAVLCLLMVRADKEIKQEELASMLNNPFFTEHVADKIGPHDTFITNFNHACKRLGTESLEKKAIAALSKGFPAIQLKTIALLTMIAGADGDYAQTEKELVARVATGLKIKVADAEHEVQRMRASIREQAKHKEDPDAIDKGPEVEK